MKIDTLKLDSPINYICFDCGNNAKEKHYPNNDIRAVTVHNSICGICKEMRPVSHVRHFGYPIFEVD